jgi:nicotinamidase-related amidase
MSSNTLARRALLVIDVQNEYVTGALKIQYPPIENSLRNIGKAMDAANEAEIPVIVVQQTAPSGSPLFATGSNGWQLHPTVVGRRRAHFVSKTLPSAFAGTDLKDWLQENRIDTVVVAGFMTHNCNDATAKHAFDSGFRVEFLQDASGSVAYENRAGTASAEEIHRVFCVVEQSRFAAVMTTEEWILCLAGGIAFERDTVYASHRRAMAASGLSLRSDRL